MTFLPFIPRFHDDIRQGRKTATTRSKAYGKPGDIVQSPVGSLRLVEVRPATLREVRDHLWAEEGLAGPAEFEAIWVEIHPRAGWNPDAVKVLHRFEYLGEATA